MNGVGIACYSNGQAALVTYPKDSNMNDEMLRRIEQKLDECLKYLRAQPTPTVEYRPLPIDEDDLDSKYGNPKVKFMAKNWKGQDVTGWNFSDCPPEYLDMHAKMLDYFAKKDSQDPVKAKDAIWRAKDAARARGWAERQRKQMAANGAATRAVNPFDIHDGHSLEDRHNDDMDIPF
ncbi:MAG: hypothetical protein ACO3VH_07200 [Ilumatobacteraceae bacterium]